MNYAEYYSTGKALSFSALIDINFSTMLRNTYAKFSQHFAQEKEYIFLLKHVIFISLFLTIKNVDNRVYTYSHQHSTTQFPYFFI